MARISEIKVVRIVNCDYVNPVYLRWTNQYGGVDYYLFQKTQDIETQTKERGTYEKYVEDFETATEKVKSIGKDLSETITLGAEMLDLNDYNGCVGIASSELVEMYVGTTWQTVVVKDGSWSKATFDQRHSIEFVITVPKRNSSW